MVAVPEGYLRTVGFLCVDGPDEHGNVRRVPQAIAFFVRVRTNLSPGIGIGRLPRHCKALH